MNGDRVLWWIGAVTSGAAAAAFTVWLVLCVVDAVWPRVRRRVLRFWWQRKDVGVLRTFRYRLGCRLLLPLIEKQHHQLKVAQDVEHTEYRSAMMVALSSLVGKAMGR